MLCITGCLIGLISGLVAGVAANLSPRVVHESRSAPPGWNPIRRAEPSTVLPLRIGLAQSNLSNIETYLLDVSHPESPNYGKHWTPTQVAQTFRPSIESVDVVREWLIESGLEAPRIKLTASGGWLQANVTIEEAERLLGTEYHVYQYGEAGNESKEHIACKDRYHLPEHVSKHVDLVMPTLHYAVEVRRNPSEPEKRSGTGYKNIGQPGNGGVSPKSLGRIETILNELQDCDVQITPDCIRALYNFVYTPVVPDRNSIGIVEYTPVAYLASDLDLFFQNFSEIQVGQRPNLISIDGGYDQTEYQDFGYNGEADLDLQYAMALVGPTQPVTLYQAGDDVEGASFGNFLDALDGSYCTYDGGDSNIFDAVYPDPYGGYQGKEDCGTAPLSNVISTSYSYTEAELGPAYTERQCAEYAKLGLMGVTFLFSSGDSGVAGNGICLDSNGYEDPYGEVFNPTFPGTCPYITSVGATQIQSGASVYDPETACEEEIYSGGGFSNVFSIPFYQKGAVENYLTKYPPPYASNIFNSSGRAYPDIAANGLNYVVAVDGYFELVAGTSCSSPVSAAILSAVNDARIAVGKSPIGFINPAIYTPAFSEAFNDITTGNNPGCDTNGFLAEPGWDPVTGLGTPNFSKLLALWLLLP
ncbi:hypothetical protein AcV5_000369 [Taiwanofungus camphoratus]|nr:hypothetical protein AcV5_000369 [Antrodia cinnamomea]